jgi:hypothetical protein
MMGIERFGGPAGSTSGPRGRGSALPETVSCSPGRRRVPARAGAAGPGTKAVRRDPDSAPRGLASACRGTVGQAPGTETIPRARTSGLRHVRSDARHGHSPGRESSSGPPAQAFPDPEGASRSLGAYVDPPLTFAEPADSTFPPKPQIARPGAATSWRCSAPQAGRSIPAARRW